MISELSDRPRNPVAFIPGPHRRRRSRLLKREARAVKAPPRVNFLYYPGDEGCQMEAAPIIHSLLGGGGRFCAVPGPWNLLRVFKPGSPGMCRPILRRWARSPRFSAAPPPRTSPVQISRAYRRPAERLISTSYWKLKTPCDMVASPRWRWNHHAKRILSS